MRMLQVNTSSAVDSRSYETMSTITGKKGESIGMPKICL